MEKTAKQMHFAQLLHPFLQKLVLSIDDKIVKCSRLFKNHYRSEVGEESKRSGAIKRPLQNNYQICKEDRECRDGPKKFKTKIVSISNIEYFYDYSQFKNLKMNLKKIQTFYFRFAIFQGKNPSICKCERRPFLPFYFDWTMSEGHVIHEVVVVIVTSNTFCTCHSKTTLRTSFLSSLLSSRVLFTFFGSQKRPSSLPRRTSWSNQTLVWYFSHRLLLRFVPGFMKQTRLKTMLVVWWFRIKARVSIWQDPSQLKSINQTTRQYGCH